MSRARLLLATAAALALGTAAFAAAAPSCTRHPSDDGTVAVDTEIMAFLSEARALHHEANLKQQKSDHAGAIHAMERLVSAQRPHPARKTPEVEEVLADAYARLAELRLERGELAEAAAAVTKGLEHVEGATYFKGHLVEVQGLVEEARAAQLADAGRAAEAEKTREHAIELLEEVVRIQDDVIKRSLASDAGSEVPR